MSKSKARDAAGQAAHPKSASSHEVLEERARAHIASWIGDPRVRQRIEELDEWQRLLLRPIRRHFPVRQDGPPRRLVAFLLAGLRLPLEGQIRIGYRALSPGGGHVQDMTDWRVDDERRAMLEVRAVKFAEGVRRLASLLRDEGVPLDPEDPSNLIVLGQYLFIQPFRLDEVAGASTADLASWPIVLSSGSISADRKAVRFSAHATERERRTLDRLRDEMRLVDGGAGPYRGAYASGHKRESPASVQERRDALREVLDAHPGSSVASLRREWAHGPAHSPGRLLRDKLGRGPGSTPPSEHVLRNDIKVIRG